MVMVVVITCLLNHYRLSARSLLSRHAPTRRRHLPLANVSEHYVSARGSVRVHCDKGVIYWINRALCFQSELRFILLPLVDDSFLLCRMNLTGRFPFHCSQCKFSLCFSTRRDERMWCLWAGFDQALQGVTLLAGQGLIRAFAYSNTFSKFYFMMQNKLSSKICLWINAWRSLFLMKLRFKRKTDCQVTPVTIRAI